MERMRRRGGMCTEHDAGVWRRWIADLYGAVFMGKLHVRPGDGDGAVWALRDPNAHLHRRSGGELERVSAELYHVGGVLCE
jgi:hypothetical protein